MTCDDLIQKGPGHNQFIILTDVHLCSRGDALRRDMDADMQMYVPIYSARLMKEPPPAELKLLLEVLDDRERERLLARPDAGELIVELWTASGQLGPWVKDRLGAIYPGMQLAKCRVLSVGLHEPSALRIGSAMQEGIVLLIVGFGCQAGWQVWRFRKNTQSESRSFNLRILLTKAASSRGEQPSVFASDSLRQKTGRSSIVF